jgi:hypothetical protein
MNMGISFRRRGTTAPERQRACGEPVVVTVEAAVGIVPPNISSGLAPIGAR